MIPDWKTNVVYFVDTLPQRHPQFYEELIHLLEGQDVDHQLLPGTNDIWARDYMPLQVRRDHFVQFVYKPDYLKSKAELASITDVDKVCYDLGISPKKSPLVVDGGNVVCSDNKVIMCDKVFKENPSYSREAVLKMLQEALELTDIFFIPTHPDDWTGHADGIVRFLDNEWFALNDLSQEQAYSDAFGTAMEDTGLFSTMIPFHPYGNKGLTSARGIYVNYLRTNSLVVVPSFGMEEDELALRMFEHLCFDAYRNAHPIDCKGSVLSIDCNGIAKEGGVLNCVSWTIQQ